MQLEKVETQFHVQRIVDMGWDALNEALLVLAQVGPLDGAHASRLVFSLSPEAAQSLADVLPQAIAGRAPEGPAKQ